MSAIPKVFSNYRISANYLEKPLQNSPLDGAEGCPPHVMRHHPQRQYFSLHLLAPTMYYPRHKLVTRPVQGIQKMQSGHMVYRPDIDGLRAVAVILVLLFHLELGVSGGFIGVDVFFVISGYLITEVVRKAVLAGRFSLADFYVRRLLRLHPALIFTVGACLAAGFVIMDPASFVSLAQSAKYAIFSASNFFFWQHQGYFEAAAKTQPLLHTWSLAAEWQFYLVWPLAVWLGLKVSERFLASALLIVIVASLGAAQLMLTKDASAAYFMMPYRVFELSIGALLVFLPDLMKKPSTRSAVTLVGLGLIVTSALILDSNSPFPGIYALAPCLGAAACIYSGRSGAAAILRAGSMVKIGLISYSVYLVHWPLLVFYKYYVSRPIGLEDKLGLFLASFILGALLYALVERQFMRRSRIAKQAGLAAVFGSVAVGLAACIVVIQHEGMPSRVPESNRAFVGDPVQFHIHNYGGAGYQLSTVIGDTAGKKIAVLGGDSFALQYAHGLDEIMKADYELMLGEFQHGCILSGTFTRIVNNVPQANCRDTYRRMISRLEGNDLPLIIAQHWAGYRGQIVDGDNKRIASLEDSDYRQVLVEILDGTRKDIGSRKMIIIGSQPILPGGASPQCLTRPAYLRQPCVDKMEYDQESSASVFVNNVLADYASGRYNTYFVDPAHTLCRNGRCKTFVEGKIFYSDAVHLSKDGSSIAAEGILRQIRKDTDI